MRFCEKIGGCQYDAPVFGTDKNTGIGYCKNHQILRTDISKKSITQRAIDKHKEQQKTKQRKPGWFDETVIEENKSALPKSFTAPKWMQDEANDVVKELKPFEGRGELGRWFLDRKSEMTGRCMHCNGDTMILNKDADSKFHYSVCHILPKNLFPSVATHPDNWIELCYYKNSCHAQLDNGILPTTQLNCFGVVIERLAKMYFSIAKDERRRIPPILLEYIKTDI